MSTGEKDTYGKRRRYGGRTVARVKHGRRWILVTRSSSSDGRPSAVIYECGQSEAYPTKLLPGRFKRQLPHGRIRFTEGDR